MIEPAGALPPLAHDFPQPTESRVAKSPALAALLNHRFTQLPTRLLNSRQARRGLLVSALRLELGEKKIKHSYLGY
jgi:hypothetical protein